MTEASPYPPPDHALHDLPFEVEVVAESEQRARLDPARWSLGALATVVDVLCGSLCAGVVAPDWMATSSLTLRTSGPAPADAPLVLDARVLRSGRRSVTIEVRLAAEGAVAPFGDAVLAFSRLERRSDNLDLSALSSAIGTRRRVGDGDRPDPAAFDRAIGPVVVHRGEPSSTETAVTPYVRNSFGAVNGGVVAAIAANAALVGAGPAAQVDEVSVQHLGQGREGPVRAVAEPLLVGPSRQVARVELRDLGRDDEAGGRLMAVAHVGVCNGSGHV